MAASPLTTVQIRVHINVGTMIFQVPFNVHSTCWVPRHPMNERCCVTWISPYISVSSTRVARASWQTLQIISVHDHCLGDMVFKQMVVQDTFESSASKVYRADDLYIELLVQPQRPLSVPYVETTILRCEVLEIIARDFEVKWRRIRNVMQKLMIILMMLM